MALPTLVHEVVHVDPLRLAARKPFPPTVFELADQLLLLGVDADHRVAGGDVVAGLVVEIAELGVAIGMLGALDDRGVGLQAEPLGLEQLGHRGRRHRCPAAASSACSRRVDFVVHRNGDSGSPRDPGSTNASRAAPKPGSVCVTGLRPPPGLRVPPTVLPASSSSTPRETVTALTPAARATVLIPPWPSDRASAPISSRRCRSSRCGSSAANLAANASSDCTAPAIPQAWQAKHQK